MFLDSIVMLTKSSTFIIGPIANIFGSIMNYIFDTLNSIGINSLGWSIILFTIIVRALMIPLAFQQQKSMQGMQKIQPQMKKIQDKYKDRKDQESQQQMQMELSQLYKENGVSPFGGCLPLLIQFPIIMALFQVLRNIPSYINSVQILFTNIANVVVPLPGADTYLSELASQSGRNMVKDFSIDNIYKVIDVLGKFSTEQWNEFIEKFGSVGNIILENYDKIVDTYTFLGINLADKPNLMSIGLLIPVLNVALQFLIMKTSSSSMGNDNPTNKSMMYTMPLITGFFVITMPAGLGLYWLVGSIFQLGQQMIINNHLHDAKG